MDSAAEPAERQVDEITSLCMNCEEDGTTRILLTRIPFFREIVIMSFSCPSCGLQNNEIQSAGEIQQRGARFTFKLDSKGDLERQIVKSDTCIFRIEDLDLEIPPGRGQLTNIEGLLSMIRQDLEAQQEARQQADQGLYSKIQEIVETLASMASGNHLPFTITLDDPAGNSTIEPSPSDQSGKYMRREYARNPTHNANLGLSADAQPAQNGHQVNTDDGTSAPDTDIRPEYHTSNMTPALPTTNGDTDDTDLVENEVYTFPSTCPGCTKPCATNMKMVRIPHFDEVVIMSTVCQYCGYRSNEVKSGGKVPEKGRRITLHVKRKEDMSRDILKAENCALSCPELSLTVEPGTLGGRFTTVEGLLTQVRDDLRASIFDTGDSSVGGGAVANMNGGDSMASQEKLKWSEFFSRLDQGINGETEFTVILEDPMAASYVQSFMAPEPDPQIEVEEYERTEGEEEHLGLKDLNTEDYGYEEVEGNEGEKEGEITTSGEVAEPIDQEEVQREVRARLAALATDDDDDK